MMLRQATLSGPHHSFPTNPSPDGAYLRQELITPCVPEMRSWCHSFINRMLGRRLRIQGPISRALLCPCLFSYFALNFYPEFFSLEIYKHYFPIFLLTFCFRCMYTTLKCTAMSANSSYPHWKGTPGFGNSIPDLLLEYVLQHSFGSAFQHHQSMLKKSLIRQKYHKYVKQN